MFKIDQILRKQYVNLPPEFFIVNTLVINVFSDFKHFDSLEKEIFPPINNDF